MITFALMKGSVWLNFVKHLITCSTNYLIHQSTNLTKFVTTEAILHKVRELARPKHAESFNQVHKTSDEVYAVGLTKLRAIAREAKRDHQRAVELWNSGVYEGKLLATLTEEPRHITEAQLNKQVKQIHTCGLADYFVKNVVAKTDWLLEKANEWTMMGQAELVRRTGYACVCELAKTSKTLDNNYFQKHLVIIELEIEKAPNWVKEGQNQALIAIGSRNKTLNKKALKIARAIGEIKVNYGETSHKTAHAATILKSEKVQQKL